MPRSGEGTAQDVIAAVELAGALDGKQLKGSSTTQMRLASRRVGAQSPGRARGDVAADVQCVTSP